MVSTVLASAFATEEVTGLAVAGCVIFAVAMELASDDQRPALLRFSRNLAVFEMPLLILLGFIVIMWAAGIIVS